VEDREDVFPDGADEALERSTGLHDPVSLCQQRTPGASARSLALR
jgi:hypothetical protein